VAKEGKECRGGVPRKTGAMIPGQLDRVAAVGLDLIRSPDFLGTSEGR
jgi:hypothetical protein